MTKIKGEPQRRFQLVVPSVTYSDFLPGPSQTVPAFSTAARVRPEKPVLSSWSSLAVAGGQGWVQGLVLAPGPLTFPSHCPAVASGSQGSSFSVLGRSPDAHLGSTGTIGGPMGSLWFTTSLVPSPLLMSSDGFMKSTRTVTMCAEY